MQKYLEKFHEKDIYQILRAASEEEIAFRALPVDLKLLQKENVDLFNKVNYRINVWKEKPKWTKALTEAQANFVKGNNTVNQSSSIKNNFPVTFVNAAEINRKFCLKTDLWHLIQVQGNVYKSQEHGKREVTREFECRKCKKKKILKADRICEFNFEIPDKCIFTRECKGTMFDTKDPERDPDKNLEHIIRYREIQIQLSDRKNSLSQWLMVELEQEQVESCVIGDRVTICGTLETRSKKGFNEHRLVFRAVSVIVHEYQQKLNIDPIELKINVLSDWSMDLERCNGNELLLRNEMVSAVSPELEGLAILKLGLLLVLCSGGKVKAQENTKKIQSKLEKKIPREISHLLMIGDPGLGKSEILRAAAEISTNAVRTVGYGATTAGLTASCSIEAGEYHFEAGALVRANNGICCLDEINLMTKEHRGSIHEVMESQKITMAKGKLNKNYKKSQKFNFNNLF
jgi:DNA replicative helicase MCM subunit Mcm2 (Cdc46/Mcm family)